MGIQYLFEARIASLLEKVVELSINLRPTKAIFSFQLKLLSINNLLSNFFGV